MVKYHNYFHSYTTDRVKVTYTLLKAQANDNHKRIQILPSEQAV